MGNLKRKVNIITLGCSKNVVDSEKLMKQLQQHGYEIRFDSEEASDIVIINTCGFINDAKQQSIDTILEYIDARKVGVISELYVMGCLTERYRDDLKKEIPEVDAYFGANNIKDILSRLGAKYNEHLQTQRYLSTPSHYAYLKISEGCNRTCAFCAIPMIRGPHRSVTIEDIVTEASLLAAGGVKELILIAQDLSYYGLDLYKKQRLADLLNELVKIPQIKWIRLHYAFPNSFPADVLPLMANEEKICKYLDIPFQHISDNMLSLMRRGSTKKEILELIANLRKQVPGIALRSSLLVGHPGETAQDFQELLDFVKETRFERLGVFSYSHEEGTHSGNTLTDEHTEELKAARVEAIMEIQNAISSEINNARIGTEMEILIDSIEGDHAIGRTRYDSPEVDGEVVLNEIGDIKPGLFVKRTITSASAYDLEV